MAMYIMPEATYKYAGSGCAVLCWGAQNKSESSGVLESWISLFHWSCHPTQDKEGSTVAISCSSCRVADYLREEDCKRIKPVRPRDIWLMTGNMTSSQFLWKFPRLQSKKRLIVWSLEYSGYIFTKLLTVESRQECPRRKSTGHGRCKTPPIHQIPLRTEMDWSRNIRRPHLPSGWIKK